MLLGRALLQTWRFGFSLSYIDMKNTADALYLYYTICMFLIDQNGNKHLN